MSDEPMTSGLNRYDAEYVRLMSDEAQDDEAPRYKEGDTPPSVDGVTLDLQADWCHEAAGEAGTERLSVFLPDPAGTGEAMLLFTLLSQVDPQRLPYLERLHVVEYSATGDLTRVPLWLEGWPGIELNPAKGGAS